jgi:imidazolonepropionase-like amidohydrolase
VPEGCTVVSGRGKYLTPGFIDSHSHLGLEEEIYQSEGDDVNEATDPATPHLRAVDGINCLDLAFGDAMKAGVTRALVVPGSANVLGGQGTVVRTWGQSPADCIYKPSWGLKAALGENPKRVYGRKEKSPMTRMASAAILREHLYVAARWKGDDAGKDLS